MGIPLTRPLKPNPLRLVYVGKLPDMHRARVGQQWRVQWWAKQKALKQFGSLPRQERRRADVCITRVLGPRERLMDEDKNLQWACGGLVDAMVTGGYLAGDDPKHAGFSFRQDASRRTIGPLIEVVITYDDHGDE